MSLLILGCLWGLVSAFVCSLIPNTSTLHVIALGSIIPGLGSISAFVVGYLSYQALTSYREAFRPELSADLYHRSTINIMSVVLPVPDMLENILHAKTVGLVIGLFAACAVYLTGVPSLAWTSVSVGLLFAGLMLNPDVRSRWWVYLIYIVVIRLLFFGCAFFNVSQPVLAVGLGFFVLPSLIIPTSRKEIKIPKSVLDEKYDKDLMKASTGVSLLSALFASMSPGVSSSAFGTLFYKSGVGRLSIYSTEVAVEVLGITLALFGVNYGSSFLNLEMLTMNLSLGWWIIPIAVIAVFGFLLCANIVKTDWFVDKTEDGNTSSMSGLSLAMNLVLLVLVCGWMSPFFLIAGIGLNMLIEHTETPAGIRAFTFLGPVLL